MSFTWKSPKDIFKGEGIYHVTWVVSGRRRILGTLEPLTPDGERAHVALTELGYRISEDLNALPFRHPGVQLIAKVVMENHIHAIIYVKADATRHIRQIAHGFRIGITHIAEQLGVWQSCTPATLSISSPTAPLTAPPRQLILEQPFIRTLVRRGQLQSMIDYVHDNPNAAYQRRLNPDLYTLRRNIRHGDFLFSTMGKSRLLDWPDRQVIELSRSLPEQLIQEAVQRALYRATLGAVTLTGAISAAERCVARAIREAGFPLVIMLLDGFPTADDLHAHYFHPGGIYHHTCGKGLLYLMEPCSCCYTHPGLIAATDTELQRKAKLKHQVYSPLPHHSKRWRMVAANQLLHMI